MFISRNVRFGGSKNQYCMFFHLMLSLCTYHDDFCFHMVQFIWQNGKSTFLKILQVIFTFKKIQSKKWLTWSNDSDILLNQSKDRQDIVKGLQNYKVSMIRCRIGEDNNGKLHPHKASILRCSLSNLTVKDRITEVSISDKVIIILREYTHLASML